MLDKRDQSMAAYVSCTTSDEYFFHALIAKSALANCSWRIAPMVTSISNIYEFRVNLTSIEFSRETVTQIRQTRQTIDDYLYTPTLIRRAQFRLVFF